MTVNLPKDVRSVEPAREDIHSQEEITEPQATVPSFYTGGKDNLSRENDFTLSVPQQAEEIVTVDDILTDLRYLTRGFPYAAVKAALVRQEEMTPALLTLLEEAIQDYEALDDSCFGYIYALFLLAYFREEAAFPLMIQLAALPDEWPDVLLDEVITECLHRMIGSVYDGNIGLLQTLIENPKTNTFSREAGLRALLVLVREGRLERTWVIDYFKSLFHHPTFLEDEEDMAITYLVLAAVDLYPQELLEDIKLTFAKERMNEFYLDMAWIDEVLAQGKEQILAKYLYQNPQYAVIDDVIEEMQGWPCFDEEDGRVQAIKWGDWLLDDVDGNFSRRGYSGAPQPYCRETPKIGRNEPCHCGSGKKYKKCCLS